MCLRRALLIYNELHSFMITKIEREPYKKPQPTTADTLSPFMTIILSIIAAIRRRRRNAMCAYR
jgi:hypothetical protein